MEKCNLVVLTETWRTEKMKGKSIKSKWDKTELRRQVQKGGGVAICLVPNLHLDPLRCNETEMTAAIARRENNRN